MASKTKILKGLKYFSQIFEDQQKEEEIQIGFPTDVKHVAHIGCDGGPSTEAPSWMKDFKSAPLPPPQAQADQPDAQWVSEDSKSKRAQKASSSSDSSEPPKPKSKDSSKSRQSRRQHSSESNDASTSSRSLPDIPRKARRKKSRDAADGSTRRSRASSSSFGGDSDGSLSLPPAPAKGTNDRNA